MKTGQRFKTARLARALTVPELAALAGIGSTTVWRIEQGIVEPRVVTARRIGEILGVDPGYLLLGDESAVKRTRTA